MNGSQIPTIFKSTFKALALTLKASKTLILTLLLISALAMNVATLTVDSVFRGLSTLLDGAIALTGLSNSNKTIYAKNKAKAASVYKAKVASLKSEISRKNKRIEKLKSHQKGLIKSQKNLIMVSDNHISNLSKYNLNLKNKNKTLNNKNKMLNNKNKMLRKKVNALKYVTHNGKRKTINEVVKETTDRVSRRAAIDASRNVASAPAEAIPYVGIGAVAVVTGWEIYDACETMKDLHNMNVAFNPNADDSEATRVCSIEVPTTDEIFKSVKSAPSKSWDKAKEWASSAPDLPDMPSWNEFSVASKENWGNFKEKIKAWVYSD